MNTVSIWDAYLTYALPFAVLHMLFLLGCLISWGWERTDLRKEKKAFEDLAGNNFKHVEYTDTEISKLFNVVLSITRKGELLSLDLLRRRLEQRFALYSLVVRTCLNAFIVSGLLGTLYNLWKLGPNFWEGLLKNQPNAGQPAIGVAFSASVFGLGSALFLMIVDTIFFRSPRERFIRKASNDLFDMSTHLLPSKEGAAVADALEKFYDTSRGFLLDLKFQHEALSQKLIEQIGASSSQLTGTLYDVSDKWKILADTATKTIFALGGRLAVEVNNLTEATNKGSQFLNTAIQNSVEAQELESLLMQIRSEASSIQTKINAQLTDLNEKWRNDLNDITHTHAEKLEKIYNTGWARYEEESKNWQQQNARALNQFSSDVKDLTAQWTEGQKSVGGHIESLISGWRGELGRNTTTMQLSLTELREQIGLLIEVAEHLSKSNDTAFQQLNSLQKDILTFSQNISNGTPVGSAMNTMTEAVRDFQVLLRNDSGPRVPGDTVVTIPKPQVSINDASIAQLDTSLRRMEGHVLHISAVAEKILKAELQRNPSKGFIRTRWQRARRIFGLGKDEQ